MPTTKLHRNAGNPFGVVSPLCGLLLLLLLSGCQFAPNASALKWPWSKKDPSPTPERILAVWTDTVLHQPQRPGVRGFGGRIYFYQKEDSDPIEVEGGLAVYVFDADNTQPHDQRPLRKFVFTAEQFASHMSRTSLGPSYSVWLPWGEVGGPPQRLSLVARFEGVHGGTTISEPTIKLLPGVPLREVSSEAELAKQRNRNGSPVQLAGHSTPAEDEPSAELRSRNVKTIDLPPSFQRHLRQDNRGSELSPTGSDASGLPTPGDGKGNAESAGPTDSQSMTLQGLDAEGLAALRAEQSSAPLTTQVIDHRSRTRRFSSNYTSPTADSKESDIRAGRWIESKPRIQPH